MSRPTRLVAATLIGLAAGLLASPAVQPASAATTPLYALEGPQVDPSGIAVGPDGLVYTGSGDTILVYDPTGAHGDEPVRTFQTTVDEHSSPGITDTFTTLAVQVDAAGYVYALGWGTIEVFAPGASGRVTPVRVISGDATQLYPSVRPDSRVSLAITSDGSILESDSVRRSVVRFAPGADGDVAPAQVLKGPKSTIWRPNGVAIGPSGELYVSNMGGKVNSRGVKRDNPSDTAILVFKGMVDGDVAPIRRIRGEYPGLMSIDSSGELYASGYGAGLRSPDLTDYTITAFAPSATGRAVPARVLRTQDLPDGYLAGLAAGPNQTVTLGVAPSDHTQSAHLLTYRLADLPAVTVPSRVVDLQVMGTPTARKRVVRWQPPTTEGGLYPAYHVTVRHAGKVVVSRVLKTRPAPTRTVLSTKGWRTGRYRVTVRAGNALGLSPAATKRFTVRH